ncbi:MAG: hypothetical protein LUF04_04290 [Bacteroides sp.]|nr:hypothetical protein [Bacteroides sp.]MCD8079645.1 hypothetical protein [Bacteroides sp.]
MGCCVSLQGIIRDCENGIGGIRRAWGVCFDKVGKPTVTNNKISAISNPSEWEEFEFRKQTGSVTTTITREDANGSLYFESAIVLQFSKQETVKRIEINAIAAGDTAWIIQDNNDVYWYFGFDYAVTLSDGTAETGTSFGDLNGYSITLNDLAKQMPYEVDETAMKAISGSDN